VGGGGGGGAAVAAGGGGGYGPLSCAIGSCGASN
jgi:hypothetical protein